MSISILSSHIILPITMHFNALLFNSATLIKKQVVIHKKYYYKLKG